MGLQDSDPERSEAVVTGEQIRSAVRSAVRDEITPFRDEMNERFDRIETELDVMRHAFLSPIDVKPGQTLADAVAEKQNGKAE